PPAQLDHIVLAADRVGAAVQHVRRRHAAREIAIDVDVGRIEYVLDAGHRADGRAAFVDGIGGDVRVAVDDAGRHELAAAVHDVGARGNRDVRAADGGNLSRPQHDGAVLYRAARDGQNRRALDRHYVWRARLRLRTRRDRAGDNAEQQEDDG